jgi:hypothetical protein
MIEARSARRQTIPSRRCLAVLAVVTVTRTTSTDPLSSGQLT